MSVVSMMSWRDKVRSSQSREEVGQIHGEEQSRYGEEQSGEGVGQAKAGSSQG